MIQTEHQSHCFLFAQQASCGSGTLRLALSRPDFEDGLSPARAPTPRDDCGDARMDDEAQIEPEWATDGDLAAPSAPDYEVDQRISW